MGQSYPGEQTEAFDELASISETKGSKRKKKTTEVKVSKKKRMFTGHTFLGLFCIIFAFLVYFLIAPLMTGVIGGQVEIPKVKTTIYAGEKITDEKIEMVKVNRGSIPTDAITAKEEAIDKFSDSKIVAGDFFMKTKTDDSQFGGGIYLEGLDGSKRIISVVIPDFAKGLSAKLKEGDIITVMAPPSDGSDKAITYPQLKYLKVLAVTLASGVDGSENTEGTTELPVTVTFLVNDTQAQLLAGLNAKGSMHMVLAYRGDEDQGNKFLQEQENYFSSGNTI